MNSVVTKLPNLVMAIVIIAVFGLLAKGAKSMVRRLTNRHDKQQSLGILLGQLAQILLVVLGVLIAISVVAPSFSAGELIKTLGIGTVAIGFAFQNILQNFLAGIFILVHEPFRIGDLISVTGIEGRVDDIQTRATVITADSGRQVVIPNATLFTNPVAVGEVPADWGKSKDGKKEPGSAAEEPEREPKPTDPQPAKNEGSPSEAQPSDDNAQSGPGHAP